MEPIKCTKCKKDKDETEFGFYRNKRRKICNTCTDKKNSCKCPHNKRKSQCKECGGSQICEHNRTKTTCKECGGSEICEHQKQKRACKQCSPLLYLTKLQRSSLHRVLKRSDLSKTKTTIEYLGCSAEHFMEYLKLKMTPDMTIYNIHIDHIKPVSRFNLDDPDEFLDCCHYTNLQPLLAKDNLEKNNKWTKKDEIYWKENIRGLETTEIYLT